MLSRSPTPIEEIERSVRDAMIDDNVRNPLVARESPQSLTGIRDEDDEAELSPQNGRHDDTAMHIPDSPASDTDFNHVLQDGALDSATPPTEVNSWMDEIILEQGMVCSTAASISQGVEPEREVLHLNAALSPSVVDLEDPQTLAGERLPSSPHLPSPLVAETRPPDTPPHQSVPLDYLIAPNASTSTVSGSYDPTIRANAEAGPSRLADCVEDQRRYPGRMYPNPNRVAGPQMLGRANKWTEWSTRVNPGTLADLMPELDNIYDGGDLRHVMRDQEEVSGLCSQREFTLNILSPIYGCGIM